VKFHGFSGETSSLNPTADWKGALMQRCNKCREPMVPKIDLTGEIGDILRRVSVQTDMLVWNCPGCGIERGAPLKKGDVADVTAYIRRQKKQWWQFWIR
jgi:RNase P subunit RPR2